MRNKFKPSCPYIGGKIKLAKHIASRINAIPHANYVEPFVGTGGIFFRRASRPKCEVINDISRDVITLFRILQRHYPQFLEVLKFQLTSRSEFERLKATDPNTLIADRSEEFEKKSSARLRVTKERYTTELEVQKF